MNAGNTLSLLKLMHENDLQDALFETVSLLKIISTMLMNTAESGRNFSTLKRVKTFTRNTMGQRLNALGSLSIENSFIHGLLDRKVILCPDERSLCNLKFQEVNMTGGSILHYK